jgi:formylglycine-generating enzyme required for sulfatase activity
MDVRVSEGVELTLRDLGSGIGDRGGPLFFVMMLGIFGLAQSRIPDPGSRSPDPRSPEFGEIPGGPFTMGADRSQDPQAFDNERWSSAQGVGTVDEAAFFIARYEVTVAEFTRFAQATKWPVDPRALAQPADHPVAFVSWPDALAYCRWLEGQLKAQGPPPVARAIAKAARGGDGRRFPWGNDPRRDRANFGSQAPVPVGRAACPECAYGLSDMAGNVWEWTRSPMQPYPYDPADDRANLEQDALWVMRGGGYADGPQLLRTTTRGAAEPGARRPFIGFRVVVSPK